MKKQILILTSVLIAGLIGCGFVLNGQWLPFLGCFSYLMFVLWVNTRTKKKPRAATQGNDEKDRKTKIINFYSSTVQFGTQTKVWTPAGKAVIPVHYEE